MTPVVALLAGAMAAAAGPAERPNSIQQDLESRTCRIILRSPIRTQTPSGAWKRSQFSPQDRHYCAYVMEMEHRGCGEASVCPSYRGWSEQQEPEEAGGRLAR